MVNDWGRVRFNKNRNTWCVEGTFKGKRYYFSQYYTDIGPKNCETEEEAKRLQLFISSEIANGVFNPLRYKKTKPIHLKSFCKKWLEKVKPTLKHGTYKPYRAAINHWITPILGDVFLPDLNYDHYLKLWTEIDRSPKYKKNIISTLYTIMEDAKRAGYLSQVPDKIVFKGKFTIPVSDIVWIDQETQDRILDEILPEDRPLFQFIIITGVRPSEARALQKSDLNYKKGYITIRYTFTDGDGGQQLTGVKQKRDRRIPFYDDLVPILQKSSKNLTPFAFINPRTGRPYTKNINRDIWNPACKKALGHLIPLNNAGRHSWGNQMSEAGIDMETISHGLGHSNTAVTKQHYANPSMNTLKTAVNNIRRLSRSQAVRKASDT